MGGLGGRAWRGTPRRGAGGVVVRAILVFPSHALALGTGPSVAGHGSGAQAAPTTPQTRAPASRLNTAISKPAGRSPGGAGGPGTPAPASTDFGKWCPDDTDGARQSRSAGATFQSAHSPEPGHV